MRFFSLTKEIAIDLGTANTVIIHNDKMVINEPSIVALDNRTDKLIAVGTEAFKMEGKEPAGIRTVRPLRKGVIADFNAAELMIRGLVKKASSKSNWFSPSLRMVVGIPSGSTEVEIRAVRDSSEHAGGRDVYMVYEPMAAALGIGLDVEAPEGNMIVDIGGGTTEIAVISLGGIVSNKSIQIAGDDLTEDIVNHMRRAHNVRVGVRTAEQIKMHVGSALTELDNPPEDYVVHGPNQMTALPMEILVSYQEISHCIEKTISKIETAVLGALEQTPPELYADIVHNGIWLAGGGALIRGLDKRLTDKIGIQFHVAEDPLLAVAKGTGVALKNIENFSFLIRYEIILPPMRNLLNFFLKYSSWLVLAFFIVVSCVLLFSRNPYQRHVWLTSAGTLSGAVYDAANNVTGYFNLREINDDLQRRTASLEAEVVELRRRLAVYQQAALRDSLAADPETSRFRFIIASVINNSVSRPFNYITIDKGETDGIRPEMGVMDQNGIVGVVNVVSPHYARVISLLNPNFRLSCKVKGGEVFGSMVWDGKSPGEALLEELPKHTRFRKGDTIVTSGYSAVFPEGIPVGVIMGNARGEDDNFFTLRIRLFTDFNSLSTVKIISNTDIDEIKAVEAESRQSQEQ